MFIYLLRINLFMHTYLKHIIPVGERTGKISSKYIQGTFSHISESCASTCPEYMSLYVVVDSIYKHMFGK